MCKIEIKVTGCYGTLVKNSAEKICRDNLSNILQTKNIKKIKTINIKLMTNFYVRGPNHLYFNKMFVDGHATIWVAPAWVKDGPGGRWYGVRHELFHLEDVLSGNIIALPLKGKEKMRIKWRKSPRHRFNTYTKVCPDWLQHELYDNEDYKTYSAVISAYWPWERKPLDAGSGYQEGWGR